MDEKETNTGVVQAPPESGENLRPSVPTFVGNAPTDLERLRRSSPQSSRLKSNITNKSDRPAGGRTACHLRTSVASAS